MKKALPIIGLLLAGIVGIYSTLPSGTSTDTSGDQTVTTFQTGEGRYPGVINIGHLVALDMAPMFIAKEAGFFAQEGLDVETVFFSNPGDNNAALVGGDLQFHINPFTLPFLGQHKGADMRIISSAGGSEIIEVLIQGMYGVDSLQELQDRVTKNPGEKIKIGTLKGDTLDMIIYRSFLEVGLTYDDFEMVWFNDLLAMVQSFKSQQIGILSHIKPYTTDLLLNYNAVPLTNNEQVRGEGTPNTTTVAMKEFIELYPETVKAYLKAQKRGADFIQAYPEKAVEYLVDGNYYAVEQETLLHALTTQNTNILLRPNIDGMMLAIGDMVNQGYI